MCGKTLNILLVDDSPIILEIISEFLQMYGHTVISFSDPLQAKHYLVENEVDVLITDFEMQPIRGDQLLEVASARNVRIKIVMSGLFDQHTRLEKSFREMGAKTLSKPFKPEDILALLQ